MLFLCDLQKSHNVTNIITLELNSMHNFNFSLDFQFKDLQVCQLGYFLGLFEEKASHFCINYIAFSVLVLDFQSKCKMCWSASWDSLQVCQGRRQVMFKLRSAWPGFKGVQIIDLGRRACTTCVSSLPSLLHCLTNIIVVLLSFNLSF